MIKHILWCGILAGVSIWLAVAPVSAQPPADHPVNTVHQTTCADFLNYVRTTGAIEPPQNKHPTFAGYTDFKINFGPKWNTPPPTIQPVGGGYNVCLKLDTLTPNFSAVIIDMDILRWAAAASISTACSNAESKFEQMMLAHEGTHESRIKSYVQEQNATWKQGNFHPQACALAPTIKAATEKAKNNLNNQVNNKLTQDAADIAAPIRKREDDWDKTQHLVFDCTSCIGNTSGKTYCPCNNPDQGKPKNYPTARDCTVNCPEGLKCAGIQCTTPPSPLPH